MICKCYCESTGISRGTFFEGVKNIAEEHLYPTTLIWVVKVKKHNMADDSVDANTDDKNVGVNSSVGNAEERNQVSVKWDSSDKYNFEHPKRGVALIVCNEKFEGNTDRPLTQRKGADLDAIHFKNTFRKFGFEDIRVKNDMTADDMVDWFSAVSKEDHSNADCLAVAITSHGEQNESLDSERYNVTECKDVIIGSEGSVFTQDLVEKFSDQNCPSLIGKPRIFLLQACRGTKLDPGAEVVYPNGEDVVDALLDPEYTISPAPCFKDFCIVYATPPGHFAFRRIAEGSWFVKALWDVVSKINPSEVNFLKLITNVINTVAVGYQAKAKDVRINAKKQSGCIYSMLTKDVYFTPKPETEEEL